VAGCDGSSKPKPSVDDAKPFAAGFVHRLVEVGTWEAVEADVSPQLTPQLRGFQAQIKKDGINRVSPKGVLRHDCPTAPVVNAGKDCFAYVVSGRQVVPLAGVQKIRARLRLWPAYEDGRWQVINYDYEVVPD
jgi:hypothetical protein